MDSPRSGFRRAAIASWTLVGAGIAGVAGASALAYADTVKPKPAEIPVDATTPADLGPTPTLTLPPIPDAITTADVGPPPPVAPVPEVTPETTVDQAPVTIDAPAATYPPEHTPTYTPEYTPQQTVEQAPAPVMQATPAPKATRPPATQHRNATPPTVMAPNYSPHVSMSHGS